MQPSASPTPPPEPLGRGATIGAFAAVVVAGLLGGTIGAGLVNVSSDDAGAWIIVGALLGAVISAGGVAVVAVLVLRAMQEWDSHQRQVARDPLVTGPSDVPATGAPDAGPVPPGPVPPGPVPADDAPADDIPSDGPIR